jgi:hypothetical protein
MPITPIYRGVLPFVLINFATLMVITYVAIKRISGISGGTCGGSLAFLRSAIWAHGFSRDGWRDPSSSAGGWVLDQFVLE